MEISQELRRQARETRVEDRYRIRDFLKVRIPQTQGLKHFTRIENLEGILLHGLLPLSELREKDIPYLFSDPIIQDGAHDGVSLSMGWHNYKMLYQKKLNADASARTDWVILQISATTLLNFDFVAFPCNASAIRAVSHPERFVGARALRSLYFDGHTRDSGRIVRRKWLNIQEYMPTDPQAEVLFLEAIPSKTIMKIEVDEKLEAKVRDLVTELSQKPIEIVSRFPSYRSDFEYWRNSGLDPDRLVREGGECGCTYCIPIDR